MKPGPKAHAMLLSAVPAEVAAQRDVAASVKSTKDELKLHLLLSSNVLIPAGDLLDSPALWELMRQEPELRNVLLEKTLQGTTTAVVSHGTYPKESLDDHLRNWLLGADRKRKNVPSAVPQPGIPAEIVASWRDSPDTLTFESYLAQSGLVQLANRRVDLAEIFSNADSIETPLNRHERFRNLVWEWLKERISQGHHSPADKELYQWYFRGEPMSRSALAANDKIWGDGAFRRKLIALRQGCATDGETRHPFEVTPPFGNAALVKTVARVFEGSKPDWQLDLAKLEFRDIQRIREDKAFALALHRISLPIDELANEPDLERFLRTEWREALLGAARPLDRSRDVIKKVTEAAGEQAVAGVTNAGNALLTAGVGALAAGVTGTAALAKLTTATALTAASPLVVPLLIVGVGLSLYLRPGGKAKAARNIANGVIGAFSAGAGMTEPPKRIPAVPEPFV